MPKAVKKPSKPSKPKRKSNHLVWQGHHILYSERHGIDWIVPVRRSVHFIITRLGRYTKGFTMKEKAALHCAIEHLPTVNLEKEEGGNDG